MAYDLKPSIERMRAKLHDIEELAFFAQADADANDKLGGKYVVLSRAIGKIAEKVRDTMTVRAYWYAKFVEEGVLKPCGEEDGVTAPGRESTARTGEEVR